MKASALFESFFDFMYLSLILFLGFRMMIRKSPNKEYRMFAWMCILLGFGDCFHLLPRAYGLLIGKNPTVVAAIGLGNAVSSIGMAVFYVIFLELIRTHYKKDLKCLRLATYVLFILRVVFVLLPQNDWIHNTINLEMSCLRNPPFILIGVIIDSLLFRFRREQLNDPLRNMWIWVMVSFGCYIPVALIHLGGMKDAILMIVKTIAYVAIAVSGYMRIPFDLLKED